MQYRTLGRTGLRVSLLSYGTGGPSNFGERTELDADAREALVRRCLDLGINLFDTAAGYGSSEERLGSALRGLQRSSFILATKWAHHTGDGEEMRDDPEELVASVNRSLSRLGTDYIDLMQFHGVAPSQYDTVVERFYPTMKRLQKEGKIRFIGFSEYLRTDARHESVTLALRSHPELWDVIMLKYGILYQWAANEALPLALQHNVGILNMAPVRLTLTRRDELEKLLVGWRQEGLLKDDGLPETDPLGWLVHDGVDSVVSAGYKFAADHPAITTVLTGTSNIEHLEKNAEALDSPRLSAPDKQHLIELFGNSVLPFTI